MNCNLYLALQIGWTRIVCKINIPSYREEMHLHSAICCLSSIFWKMNKFRALLNFFFQLITQLLHKLYTCCKLCYFEILYLNQYSFFFVLKNSPYWFHVAERPLLQNFNSCSSAWNLLCILFFSDSVDVKCSNNSQ